MMGNTAAEVRAPEAAHRVVWNRPQSMQGFARPIRGVDLTFDSV